MIQKPDNQSLYTSNDKYLEMCDILDSLCGEDEAKEDKNSKSTSPRIDPADLVLHQCLSKFAMSISASSRVLLVDEVLHLLRLYPSLVQVFDERGYLPLHIACRDGAPLEIIHLLVKEYPDSVKTASRNRQRMLPLHMTCRYYSGRNSQKTRIIKLLTDKYPEAAQIVSGQGEMPLHLLCQNYFCTVRDLRIVSKAYPKALTTMSKSRRPQIPLHIACASQYMERIELRSAVKLRDDVEDRSSTSDDIIYFLLKACPDTVQRRNYQGELPLHLAVKGHQSLETLDLLLSMCPKAAQCCDDTGRTSLHTALTRKDVHPSVIDVLLEAHPDATKRRDDSGRRPFDYAQRRPSVYKQLRAKQIIVV